MMETPCPPFYAEPTHQKTILFSTSSYARNTNDWYQCIEGAYCNAPSFLGYNPPGEGLLWQKAWKRLDAGYPCNSALDTSTTGFLPDTEDDESSVVTSTDNNQFGNSNLDVSNIITTLRPTSRPTTIEETPSLVSGQVWYDSNGDGRKNTALNALSQMDYESSLKERGAGISNMRVTLRQCSTNNLLSVTYTFPRSFGFTGSGSGGGGDSVEVIDGSYIQQVQNQEKENMEYTNLANDGLGIGNTESKLGFYSFRVLPSQIDHDDFYVVFEAPNQYRLTTGSGEYWEVYQSVDDIVQPVMEAEWLDADNADGSKTNGNRGGNRNRKRVLQTLITTNGTDDFLLQDDAAFEVLVEEDDDRPQLPDEPINYSGYYARSECFPIEHSPSQVKNIDIGLTKDSWPLVPYQYASFVVTIRFYDGRGQRRRNSRHRQLQPPLSLECRKYLKDKQDGKKVEDLWNCEQGPSSGGNTISLDFEDLTLVQGDQVSLAVQDFLGSRVSRAWTVKLVSLAHQEMQVFESEEDESGSGLRRLVDMASSFFKRRELQVNREVANLVLGFRVRAEYTSDKSGEDLSQILSSSISGGSETFLNVIKRSVPSYFQLAGGISVRDVLWTPPPEIDYDAIDDDFTIPTGSLLDETLDEGEGGSNMGMIFGIVTGTVVIVAFVAMFLMYRNRKMGSNINRKKRLMKLQAKRRAAAMKKAKTAARRNLFGDDSDSSSVSSDSSSVSSDDDSDLSSRWFSDASNFDPGRIEDLEGFSQYDNDSYSDVPRLKSGGKSGHSLISNNYSLQSISSRESDSYTGSSKSHTASQSGGSYIESAIADSYDDQGSGYSGRMSYASKYTNDISRTSRSRASGSQSRGSRSSRWSRQSGASSGRYSQRSGASRSYANQSRNSSRRSSGSRLSARSNGNMSHTSDSYSGNGAVDDMVSEERSRSTRSSRRSDQSRSTRESRSTRNSVEPSVMSHESEIS